MIHVSRKAQQIPPFLVMEVLERAQQLQREGVDVIHLEVGEPDFATPQCVKQAAIEGLQRDMTHYTHSMGRIELRQAICELYRKRYGVEVSPERVIVTSGTSPAMLLAFAALLDPGDDIVLTNPHYACYPNFIRLVDGEPNFVDVSESDGFAYRPQRVREKLTPRTRGILVNSPGNPTGTLVPPEVLAQLCELGPPVISDEIYHGLVYQGQEHTILEFCDHALVLNGFSKLYAMTGWRLGWVIAPEELVRPMQKLQQNFFIAAADFVQHAALSALRDCDDEVETMRAEYDRRRKVLVPRLREIGFRVAGEPNGAFYVFAGVDHWTDDCRRFAFDVLEQAHVAITPGVDFGSGGEGYVRFSYANSLENIIEGCERLERFIAQR
ncbi:MAG: pyridoxal phosphate-dependent aminotransferase [Candidatus Alcyoniella australis]|nr:pyridoxal phosphate-dependent aminotransferase [Candidatus Alcyoniella australis]